MLRLLPTSSSVGSSVLRQLPTRVPFTTSPSVRPVSTSQLLLAKRWTNKTKRDYEDEFDNPVREVAGMNVYPEKGYVVDKRPFKMKVEKYVEYVWCGCGYGRTRQPLCDQSCECRFLKKVIRGGPVRYVAPEDKEVWFCNCKQTENRPFCDGSHRAQEVQDMRLDYTRELWEPRDIDNKQKTD